MLERFNLSRIKGALISEKAMVHSLKGFYFNFFYLQKSVGKAKDR